MIKAPSVRPEIYEADYQHLDFVPTLIDVLGITGQSDFVGKSVFDSTRPKREKVFYTKGVFGIDAVYTYDTETGVWRLRES